MCRMVSWRRRSAPAPRETRVMTYSPHETEWVDADHSLETDDEWQLLAQLGCDFAQGFLISAPVPGDQLPASIQRWRQTHP